MSPFSRNGAAPSPEVFVRFSKVGVAAPDAKLAR
jgi:hypothetical protein